MSAFPALGVMPDKPRKGVDGKGMQGMGDPRTPPGGVIEIPLSIFFLTKRADFGGKREEKEQMCKKTGLNPCYDWARWHFVFTPPVA